MTELTERRYRDLKRNVESAKAEAERARGALEQLMSRLKSEFDCGSLKEAKAMLEDLTSKRDKAERDFERALTDYERKWKAA